LECPHLSDCRTHARADRARWLWRALALCILAAAAEPLFAQQPPRSPSVQELKRLTVEELMSIQVTSVSRTTERLGDAAAAIAVITSDDIRRSGATSVPEALRLVPGIHVARQTSNTWAVSARGFSSVTSEKLLALTDTRSLYTPLFSGVFWDAQGFLLQDIDRIEVIRGPGATQWGSNAVNGVVSITTKSARDTQGSYFESSAGTEERVSVGARYGGRIGARSYYRVFGNYVDRDATFRRIGEGADDWQNGRAGFRTDWESGVRDALTLQGEVYRGDVGRLAPSVTIIGRPGPAGPLRVQVTGGNVAARWRRGATANPDMQLRVYYDRTHRDDPSFEDTLDTFDADLQRRHVIGGVHDVLWGLNYRLTANQNESGGVFALEPSFSRDHLVSGFVQDQIRVSDALRVTLGTKLEHNDFSGWEAQPSGRASLVLAPGHTVWGAVSRAVRVPTRLERDIAIDVTDPQRDPVARLLGRSSFDSERMVAYEAGYRWLTLETLSVDSAVFHNRYDGLASLELGAPSFDPDINRTIIPLQNHNLTEGDARGLETSVTYSPIVRARFSGTYAYVHLSLRPRGSDLNRGAFLDGATPRHQAGVRASFDLPSRVRLDAQLRHLSAIRRLPPVVSGEGLPGYRELDVRLAWDAWRQLELSIVGQNLLHARHVEFGPADHRGEIERGVYLKAAWGF
jgi:iron complex outermembrane recepter protein